MQLRKLLSHVIGVAKQRRFYVLGLGVVAIIVCVVAYWATILVFISLNFGIPFATVILAIYGVVWSWWSHKRGLLDSKRDLIHDLHVSLEEFNQICRNIIPGARLSSSANSALARFSEVKARSSHVTPEYLTLVANEMADQLSKLATGDEHTIEKVKDIFNDLIFLSSRYEERFKIHNEYRASRFLWVLATSIRMRSFVQNQNVRLGIHLSTTSVGSVVRILVL